MQHLTQENIALRLLYLSYKSCPLSTVDKGNKKELSKDKKTPIKNFLEWNSVILEAVWPDAQFLHILEEIKYFK